jgi:hypothetical protein
MLMKISEYKNEDAIELLADIMEPAVEIFGDAELRDTVRGGNTDRMAIAKMVLKNHPKEVLHIMAILDGVDPDKYEANVFTLPLKLMEIMNDEGFLLLFQSQVQNTDETFSGPVTEITEAEEI